VGFTADADDSPCLAAEFPMASFLILMMDTEGEQRLIESGSIS
jgi:hypothetical protein